MYRRAIAGAVALVLIAAQLLASAHFHQNPLTVEFAASSGDAICAICVVRTHAPAASIGSGAVFVPLLTHSAPIPAVPAGSLAPRVLCLLGRAPPLSR